MKKITLLATILLGFQMGIMFAQSNLQNWIERIVRQEK